MYITRRIGEERKTTLLPKFQPRLEMALSTIFHCGILFWYQVLQGRLGDQEGRERE